jgi:hypothetical protein|tara:strand:+ start:343 stop:480 length:138 start_codon:yes stop_codon:yes gene_type:complete
MIEWIVIMFVPILFWIGNSLANIATGIKKIAIGVRLLEESIRGIN